VRTIKGPSTKLALLQGFARGLKGPLRLSGRQELPPHIAETHVRARNAIGAQKLPALQIHSMSQLSPRGKCVCVFPNSDDAWTAHHS